MQHALQFSSTSVETQVMLLPEPVLGVCRAGMQSHMKC